MIVQPCFDRVLIPLLLLLLLGLLLLSLLPEAGAGPLHGWHRAPRRLSGTAFPPQLGSVPQKNRTRPRDPPPSSCSSRAGFRQAAGAPGQPPAPPRPARFYGRPGVVGGARRSCRAPPPGVRQCSALAGSSVPWFPGGGGGSGARRALRKPSGGGWKEAARPLGCAVCQADFWGAR